MPMFYTDKTEFGLTWEDWCDTSIKKLALRHVTDRTRADHDRRGVSIQIGGAGDAASLVIPWLIKANNDIDIDSMYLKGELQKRLEHAFMTTTSKDPVFNFFKDHILAEHKKFLEPGASLKTKQDALTKIFNFLLYFWVRQNEALFEMQEHFYLLIAHSGAETPYDFGSYPLGKCGSNGHWPKAVGTIYVAPPAHYNIDKAFSQITRLIQASRKGTTTLPDTILASNEMENLYPTRSVDKFSVPTPHYTYYWGRISVAVSLATYGLYRAISSGGSEGGTPSPDKTLSR